MTVPAGANDTDSDTATLTAKSTADPTVSATATVKTIAVGTDTLLVDDDTNAPVDSQPRYEAAFSDNGIPTTTWDLSNDAELPVNYMKAFKTIVWFTGNAYPGPLLAYEGRLQSYLDGGGTCSSPGRTSSTRVRARRTSSATTCTSPGTGRRRRTTSRPRRSTASPGR